MRYTPLPMKANGHYVYIHSRADAGDLSVESAFYVGKGVSPSGRGGVDRAWKVEGRSQYWSRIAQKHGRLIWVVAEGLSAGEALAKEAELIAFLRACGCMLANMNAGGFGGALEGESLERMRQSLARRYRDDCARAKHSALMMGVMRDPAIREKLSRANLGKPRDEAVRKAISEKLKGRKRSESERKALLSGWRGEGVDKRLAAVGAKPVVNVQTGERFRSASDAARYLRESGASPKAQPGPILLCCNGKAKTAYGFVWAVAPSVV